MHLTVGTAFTITIFTSAVSVMTHHKNKLVDFRVVKTFGVFVHENLAKTMRSSASLFLGLGREPV